MRTSKLVSVLALSFIFAFTGCKKDKNPPTINVNGANPATVAVGAAYTDAGATATNPDGSSATVVTDASAANTAVAGSFNVNYSAENEYGTSTAVRTVNVVLDQSHYVGMYDLTSDCGATIFPLNATQDVSAGSTPDSLYFNNFFTAVGGTAYALINGSDITFPSQTINIVVGDITFDGTGTMNGTGSEMTVNFNYDNTTPFVGGAGSCAATITKQ